mmetsp:Transcript_4627/g.9724  ORF Transcript_4627/g.9724 Transcript_4627/m.9724 type:complete len:106 (-) Transcript_4627:7-324(-)
MMVSENSLILCTLKARPWGSHDTMDVRPSSSTVVKHSCNRQGNGVATPPRAMASPSDGTGSTTVGGDDDDDEDVNDTVILCLYLERGRPWGCSLRLVQVVASQGR